LDLLSDILTHLKLKGTLYFRTSFTSPWSVQVPAYRNVARFHYAHQGRCLVRIDGHAVPVPVEQGDLIIIMRGASHTIYSSHDDEHPTAHLEQVIEQSGFNGRGTLIFGEFGASHETQLICGHYALDEHASHPLIDALPSHIHIKNYGETCGGWLENTLRVIGAEAGRDNLGADIISLKLSEIVFTQVLRSYLESAGNKHPALAGYSDKRITRALDAIHDNPGHHWTLDKLAATAGMSRTSFSTTFTRYLSMSPLAYLTQWRMQLARQILLDTDDAIIDIAAKSGYQSEAAFSRVFKKHFQTAPATYRRTRQQATN
jgi:AraC-like DNA-binding protein